MDRNDIIGAIGVGFVLLAYFCNTFGLIKREGRSYFMLNGAGAALACYASFLINYIPFVILEGVWAIVSVAGLVRVFRE